MTAPVIIPFSDDSTLFFALRMRASLKAADPSQPVELAWYAPENALSERQMEQNLPQGPDMALRKGDFQLLLNSDYAKAIVTSRMFAPLRDALRNPELEALHKRPAVVAFLGGIDFFPEDGFARRSTADIVYVIPRSGVDLFDNFVRKQDADKAPLWREVRFGHPTFLQPQGPPSDLKDRRDVYFFAQALSPSTAEGRAHMLHALSAMARAHIGRTFWIKLRHLPDENQRHLHKEKHDYPALLSSLDDTPDNLRLTACTMDQALASCALGITCTSTAAIDIIREGIPCMVHLDYVDAPLDALNAPMAKLFDGSGLVTSLQDMLHLRSSEPNSKWIEQNFCTHDLGRDVLDSVSRFHDRAFQVPVHSKLQALRALENEPKHS